MAARTGTEAKGTPIARSAKRYWITIRLQNTPQTKTTVIENLAAEYGKYDEPLKMRLDPFWIDTLLRFELHNKGVNLPFSYEVTTCQQRQPHFFEGKRC